MEEAIKSEDPEVSKKLLSNNDSPAGCLINAKPPENIKHLIHKDEITGNKSIDGTGGDSSPVGLLLDTMGIESLCSRYNISLRQNLFLASLYLIIIGNLVLLTITLALQQVLHNLLKCFFYLLSLCWSEVLIDWYIDFETIMLCNVLGNSKWRSRFSLEIDPGCNFDTLTFHFRSLIEFCVLVSGLECSQE